MADTTAIAKKKPNKLGTFFRGVWSELKKVHWPTKRQLVIYTIVVLLTCFALALVISLFDWIVSSLLTLFLSIS